ncbi:MAG: HAMP domain-containing protein [Gemmatimonadetes bacterium]|nr:HAMP domain-containing protein [Gemmatimonadota bacterium]
MVNPAGNSEPVQGSAVPAESGEPGTRSARPSGWRRLGLPVLTLSTRVAVTAGFFVLLSVAGLSFLLIRAQREQVLAEVIHGSESIAQAILLSIDRDMRLNQRDGLRELVAAMGTHAGIASIRIYNKDGRISFSSRPEEEGERVDTRAEACVQCHSGTTPPAVELAPARRSRIYRSPDGERRLGTIYVIANRDGCQDGGCHGPPSEQRLLGVLDVGMSREPAQARPAAASRSAILISLAATLLIAAALFLIVRRSVQRPINRMVSATRRIAAGGPSLHVPEGAVPEIGILAASFNELIEGFSSSNQKLEDWASSLEEKVSVKATELRTARSQVIQAEKLASVGVVAAGIAHELNSPLMAIITFTHLVRGTVPPDSRAFEDLRMIEREANRCAAIIRQLLDFSRQQQQEPEKHASRISSSLDKALDLLKVEVRNSEVAVQVAIPENLPRVNVNDGQLMQVFVNLFLNAVQAMPHGGELRVTADLAARRDLPPLELPAEVRKLVRITVRDTGTGIKRPDLTRVFDPFFTTKPPGKGSGLGLSVSMGIIQGFGGTILVDSDGMSWTQFTVLIPALEEPAPQPV